VKITTIILIMTMIGMTAAESWIDDETVIMGPDTWYDFDSGRDITGDLLYIDNNYLSLGGSHTFNITPSSEKCNASIILTNDTHTEWNVTCGAGVTSVNQQVGKFTTQQYLYINDTLNSTLNIISGHITFNYTGGFSTVNFELRDADNLPPAIYIYLSRRGITWIEFNWTATDVSAHNTTIIYLVENDTGLIWENVTTGLTYTYKFDNLYNTTVYTVFVNETDIHGNSNETNLSVSTLTGKGTVPFTPQYLVSGTAKFQGLLWQFEMMIVGVAASISVLGILRPKVPVLGVVSGIYWMYAAIGSAKTIIYLSNGTSVYYLGGWYLIYLFGGFGLLMIVYALFNYLSNTQEVVNAMVSPDSMREY